MLRRLQGGFRAIACRRVDRRCPARSTDPGRSPCRPFAPWRSDRGSCLQIRYRPRHGRVGDRRRPRPRAVCRFGSAPGSPQPRCVSVQGARGRADDRLTATCWSSSRGVWRSGQPARPGREAMPIAPQRCTVPSPGWDPDGTTVTDAVLRRERFERNWTKCLRGACDHSGDAGALRVQVGASEGTGRNRKSLSFNRIRLSDGVCWPALPALATGPRDSAGRLDNAPRRPPRTA